MRIGLMHPGEMGAAVGGELVGAGHEVLWVAAGRSDATRARAEGAGLRARDSIAGMREETDLVLSICPPHAAREVAREFATSGFGGTYVDANAVAPAGARAVAETVEASGASYVDAGIVGSPPGDGQGPRLYLSGAGAERVADLFAGTLVEAIVLSEEPFAASQLKMAYAAWSKGSAALLLTAMEAARRSGLGEALAEEWSRSQPQLAARLRQAQADEAAKGWRWAGEMEEVARSMRDLGLPEGFHRAAARVFAGEEEPEGSGRPRSV